MTCFNTIDDMPARQTVLTRIDINAPVKEGVVQDCKRFERHAATITDLLDRGHAVALLAHQGRPGRDSYMALEQHADILSTRLRREVRYVDDVGGEKAATAVNSLDAGDVLLLENTRFSDHELRELPPERHAENGFVQNLSAAADCFVNDAYSAAHRSHASLVGFPAVMDAYAGPVMAQEYRHNSRIRNGLDGRTTIVLGGKKTGDVLHVMDRLIADDAVDSFLMGGLVGELFLRAEGHDVGYDVDDSRFMHKQWLAYRDTVKRLLADHRGRIHLPLDLAFHDADRERTEVAVSDAAKEEPYWDIGHETMEQYTRIIRHSDAVLVKGAPGVFEDETFAHGTKTLLEAIGTHGCFSVVGGGDTSRCIDLYDLDETDFDHVSIAGGAYIRALTGEPLPAVEALRVQR